MVRRGSRKVRSLFHVWVGHSCPAPLKLQLTLISARRLVKRPRPRSGPGIKIKALVKTNQSGEGRWKALRFACAAFAAAQQQVPRLRRIVRKRTTLLRSDDRVEVGAGGDA